MEATMLNVKEKERLLEQSTSEINNAIAKLSWDRVQDALGDEDNSGYYLCNATEEEWTTYVESEEQKLKSKNLTWNNGKLYITELPSNIHDTIAGKFTFRMLLATGTEDQHLIPHGAAYVDNLPHYEPDCSFGPSFDVPGTRIPPQLLSPLDFHTLKVEVGVSQNWRGLEQKVRRWWSFPGLRYILCIRVTPGLLVKQYKLYVVNQAPPPQINPTDIVNPTIIEFDSRILLGLEPDAALPQGFADPSVNVDLFGIVRDAIAHA